VAEDIPSARVGLQRLSRLEHLEDSEREALAAIADPVAGQATSRAHEQGVQEVRTEIRLGKAAHEIMAFAEECKADLIVMGRRGLGSAADLLLGSVSSRVAERADCACLTVK
jgi:nucleotide-binding universal stress UspA family protein